MVPTPFGTVTDAVEYVLCLGAAMALWRATWRGRALPGVRRGGTLLVGHRGTRSVEPENTLAAFRRAFDEGLDGVEFDVQRSLDGTLVLTHDDEVEGRLVSVQRYGELRDQIPGLATLGELLTLARAYPGRLLNLEIKASGWRTRGLERAVVSAVREADMLDRVLISSFNPLSVARVRFLDPSLRVALLYDESTRLRPGLAPRPGWLHVDAVHPRFPLVDRAFVRTAHRRGVAVNVWTVNQLEDMRRLRAIGVDAIMGDDPATLRSGRAEG